ncbi:VOC family protein [Actinomadura alba]|uniref:VOC family protein n=1 Tax=Actinomadura alba TaxID=406431 RepID=UPI0031D8C4CE
MVLPTIYPAVRYDDPRAAIEWLVKAFGLTEHFVAADPNGTIHHAELAWGDGGMVMLGATSDGSDGRLAAPTGAALLYLVVDDPDAHYERAVAAGATIEQPLKDEDYGSRGYTARDPEGNLWSFGTYQPAKAGA